MYTITREHEFCYGHRVYGHESKCSNLHGHNAKVIFTVAPCSDGLDALGRVIDFAVVKQSMCQWIEDNWDHRMLLWDEDPFGFTEQQEKDNGIVRVPFNPTAENMADYLLRNVAPSFLPPDVRCTVVQFFETSKCSAMVTLL